MADTQFERTCFQFSQILNGKSKTDGSLCSIPLKRQLTVNMQGKKTTSVLGVNVTFESLDTQGNALNIAEVVLLEEEVPHFLFAVMQQGLIVSALHNHWLYTNPNLMYTHVQSVEPPTTFAQKISNAFGTLSPPPVDVASH
ncbi:DUF1259 domain-containing protein [Sporosarcina sp. BI001-red]|uniref:DUF1259 domain-containing protein n=1 Tax=Sporosarcina sp. BI001-red TaxID=2282866 RepID=UPI000E245A49|nr:DUF1259 domain-containing protein [Sporosarcina sp. BI001-red]REB05624.1 DUF1259 domain-containing protein [Sporosarcina sp. BI001-red]